MITSTLQIESINVDGYEKVVKIRDEATGLHAIVAVHNTKLGPALGGIRIYPYADTESALVDVLRLAKGMTYKSAIAATGLGGGKSVIIADPRKGHKTTALLHSFAEAINSLGGEYICAEDVGCSTTDVDVISKKTPFVVGLTHEKSSGDPSIFTAYGTYEGILSSWKAKTRSTSLEGVKVLIQGLGAVGEKLVEWLFWAGAKLLVCDLDSAKVQEMKKKYGAESIDPHLVYEADCDVFSPCAMGGILNEENIKKLNCKVVAGCANNQLLTPQDDRRLLEKGILYAPDFVINAGGIINVSFELQKQGYCSQLAREAVSKIPLRLEAIFQIAIEKNIGTQEAAIILAEDRLKNLIDKRVDGPYFHHQ